MNLFFKFIFTPTEHILLAEFLVQAKLLSQNQTAGHIEQAEVVLWPDMTLPSAIEHISRKVDSSGDMITEFSPREIRYLDIIYDFVKYSELVKVSEEMTALFDRLQRLTGSHAASEAYRAYQAYDSLIPINYKEIEAEDPSYESHEYYIRFIKPRLKERVQELDFELNEPLLFKKD